MGISVDAYFLECGATETASLEFANELKLL